MDWMEWIAIIASISTLVSVCANIIQYDRQRIEIRSLRTHAQATYNFHFLNARAITRTRQSKEGTVEARLENMKKEMEFIRGVADTARNYIIAFSREHLDFVPSYEHPAYPGKEQSDEVKMGKPPEEAEKGN